MCYPPSTFDMHVATWICSSAYHVVVNIPHLHLWEGLIHCNWKILPCQQEGAKNHNPPCCICIIRVTRKMPGLVGLWVTKQVQMWLSLHFMWRLVATELQTIWHHIYYLWTCTFCLHGWNCVQLMNVYCLHLFSCIRWYLYFPYSQLSTFLGLLTIEKKIFVLTN